MSARGYANKKRLLRAPFAAKLPLVQELPFVGGGQSAPERMPPKGQRYFF